MVVAGAQFIVGLAVGFGHFGRKHVAVHMYVLVGGLGWVTRANLALLLRGQA